MSDNENDGKTRRTFLSALGATGALLGVGRIVDAERQQVATSYRFGGRVAGWQGREPESIAGTTNPTLNLEASKQYEITWENVDGAPHNVAILSENGEVVVRTEIISNQGATQTVQFTASEEMATYICQVHPTSMQGDVVVEGGAQQARTTTANQTAANRTRVGAQETMTTPVNQTTVTQTAANRTRVGAQETTTAPVNQTQNQTTTIPNPTEAPVEETTHPLADEFGENPVKFAARLEPAEGVQTEADGRAWFTLHPPNGARATLMYSLHLQNAENVTSVHVHLDRPGNPVVAQPFQPDSPVDVIEGTLVDSQITADDLTGPFQNSSLLRLTEAIRNDNAYVDIHTQEQPDGLLRGQIRAVEAAGVPTTGTETERGTETEMGTETTAGTNATEPNGIDSDDVAQQVRAPGFGVLSTLGGLGGVVGYLLSRAGDSDD